MTPFWLKIRPGGRLLLFLFLSAFIAAQMTWWMIYQVRTAKRIATLQEEVWERETRVAERLIARHGALPEDSLAVMVERLFDDLELQPGAITVAVRDAARERLASETTDVARMFAMESATFLVIILAGMIYMYVALRREIQVERQYATFLSAVTHELRSPISAIGLLLESLRGDLDPARREQVLAGIGGSLERLTELVDRLLKTREFVGRSRLNHFKVADLAEITRAMLSEIERHHPGAAGRLSFHAPGPLYARVDLEHWRILVSNLVDNALKYSKPGDPVEVRFEGGGARCRLQVTDRGAGFVASERQRIFRRFYRIGDENTRGATGSGLGLYLVREIARSFHGAVSAHSDGIGRGATFTVQLPIAKSK